MLVEAPLRRARLKDLSLPRLAGRDVPGIVLRPHLVSRNFL